MHIITQYVGLQVACYLYMCNDGDGDDDNNEMD